MSNFILIPTMASGGAQRVALNLLNNLGVFDYIVVIDDSNIAYDLSHDKLISLKSPHSENLFKKSVNLLRRYVKLKKLKRMHNVKLTLSLLEPANLLNTLTKIEKEKVIVSFRSHYTVTFNHDPFVGRGFTRHAVEIFYRFSIKRIHSRADLVVVVSECAKSDLIKNFGLRENRVKVIYNPVDIERIRVQALEPVGDYERIFEQFTLITAGRLTKQKGQWYLLRIFRELKKEFIELKLVILGEGELKDYLVCLSEKLGLRTYVWDRDKLSGEFDVYFLGFQSNPFKFIARSKLFVFPSLWEGFPNALVEAMACGVPVVSADCRSGPREILAPDTDPEYQTSETEFAEYGVLMPVFESKFKNAYDSFEKEEKKWVETLIKLFEEDTLISKYKERVLKRVSDFNISKITKEWRVVIEDL